MFFSWLKKRRRRKLLEAPFPGGWLRTLESNVAHYRLLSAPLQAKLRDITRILVAEKDWVGCRGLVMNEEIQVTIAALAGMLILGQEGFYFDNVYSVLVYPRGYRARRRQSLGGEAVIEGEDQLLGEAEYNGPILLSWKATLEAAVAPGYGENLVFHEFAHKIDMLSGDADGAPPMPAALARRWQPVMKEAYDRLCRDVDAGRDSFLDPYGATNEAEFFAVITEAFFDHPAGFQEHHPDLYDLLRDFYRLDPKQWFRGFVPPAMS